MVEQRSRFLTAPLKLKTIAHDQNNVNVVRLSFGRDKTSEYDHTIQVTCPFGQFANASQRRSSTLTTFAANTESINDFVDARSMNPYGQVTIGC